MKLPKSLAKTTPFSKILSFVLFITLPLVFLYYGLYLGVGLSSSSQPITVSRPPKPTFTPTPVPLPTLQPSPTSKPISTKRLSYSLPANWKTVSDSTNRLQIAYNPQINQAILSSPPLVVATTNLPQQFGYDWNARIVSYSGGSRHQAIYSILGISGPKDSDCRPSDFRQMEYLYNGWNCLVLHGLCVSQSPTTHGFCPTSATQGIFFQMEAGLPASNQQTEQLISTIKILK